MSMAVNFCSERTFSENSIEVSRFEEKGCTFGQHFDLGGGVMRLIIEDFCSEMTFSESSTEVSCFEEKGSIFGWHFDFKLGGGVMRLILEDDC